MLFWFSNFLLLDFIILNGLCQIVNTPSESSPLSVNDKKYALSRNFFEILRFVQIYFFVFVHFCGDFFAKNNS